MGRALQTPPICVRIPVMTPLHGNCHALHLFTGRLNQWPKICVAKMYYVIYLFFSQAFIHDPNMDFLHEQHVVLCFCWSWYDMSYHATVTLHGGFIIQFWSLRLQNQPQVAMKGKCSFQHCLLFRADQYRRRD